MISFTPDQIYIVTGASSGLGEATALLLNKLGATVVAIARNEERLNKMKSRCEHPEHMHIEIKDLAEDIGELPKYVKALKEKYGKFSGLAYCAGIGGLLPLLMIEYETAEKIFKTNYFAPLFFAKGFLDRRNNIGRGASLVFLSSLDALANTKGQPLYGGSKAALSASMKSVSKDVAPQGIRINCLLPSMIATPMTLNDCCASVNTHNEISEKYPFGWGEPDDVANMVVYLLSDKAKYISGQNYVIDSGGML